MQSVRCDACGMKALVAASQCPHCGHLFNLRDSFGELLPLTQCPTCESYYPLARGECQWCGTKPEPRRLAPHAWKIAAVVGFVALAAGATIAHRGTPRGTSSVREESIALFPETPATEPTSDGTDSNAPTTSAQADSVALSTERADSDAATASQRPEKYSATTLQPAIAESIRAVSPSEAVGADDVPGYSPAPSPAPATPAIESRAIAIPARPPAARERERARLATKPKAPSQTKSRWVRAVARGWIPVHNAASRNSHVVASIGPDTHVQLGETRGDWVRLKSHGLSGWVERNAFPVTREVVSRR